jgi:hypothetical protein
VRALRKPSRPAWLINRIAISHPERLERLVSAADRLREGGSTAQGLRDAAASERRAVEDLVELAGRELGGDSSRNAAVLDRVRETLQAIAVDPATRERALAGRLVREQRAATLGGALLEGAPSPRAGRRPKTRPKRKPAVSTDGSELRRARSELKRLRKRAETARGQAKRATDAVKRAEARIEKARGALERAELEGDAAREKLASAESVAGEAEARAQEGEARIAELERGG